MPVLARSWTRCRDECLKRYLAREVSYLLNPSQEHITRGSYRRTITGQRIPGARGSQEDLWNSVILQDEQHEFSRHRDADHTCVR